jgi:hypothetical protein
MELRTPARNAAVAVSPVAEIEGDISKPGGALAQPDRSEKTGQPEKTDRLEKADRLEIAAARSATPAQPAPVDERFSPPKDIAVGSPAPPKVTSRHRHDPKPKKVTAASAPKSKPKTADATRPAISERRKAASAESCRLGAFGGLRRALGSTDCEI